ncbi:fungal-specific transcription factor domain-containing protein [Zopfochytrium polystomum]|nr:fungal-specific transcription factor domain-containing protein [Zopfochytrium polystomum]
MVPSSTSYQYYPSGYSADPGVSSTAAPSQQPPLSGHSGPSQHFGRIGHSPPPPPPVSGSSGAPPGSGPATSPIVTQVLSASKAPRRWSCEPCRARKIKCDGVRPCCGNCIKRSIKRCIFLGTKTKVDSELAEKNMVEIEERNKLRVARFGTNEPYERRAVTPPSYSYSVPESPASVQTTPTQSFPHYRGLHAHTENPSATAPSSRSLYTHLPQSQHAPANPNAAVSHQPAPQPAPSSVYGQISTWSPHESATARAIAQTYHSRPQTPRPTTPPRHENGCTSSHPSAPAIPSSSFSPAAPTHSGVHVSRHPLLSEKPTPEAPKTVFRSNTQISNLPPELVLLLDGKCDFYGVRGLPLPKVEICRVLRRPGAPLDEERTLVDNFFDHYYCPVSFIHRRSYLANLQNVDPFLRMAVCAAGSMVPSKQAFRKGARWYYKQAKVFSTESLDSPSLETVQGWLILGWASLCFRKATPLWLYMSMATRMAAYLRLNEESFELAPTEPWLEKETRIRTWWACYFVDRFTVVFSHLPPLAERGYTEKIPLCREDIWTSWRAPSALAETYAEHRKPDDNSLTYCILLWELFTKVQLDIRGYERRKEESRKQIEGETVESILESLKVTTELESWLRQLPPKFWLRLDDEYMQQLVQSSEVSTCRELSTLFITYHGLICCSTRRSTLWFLQQACGRATPYVASGGTPRSPITLPGLSHILTQAESTRLLENAASKALASAEAVCTLAASLIGHSARLEEFAPSCLFFVFEAVVTVFLMEMGIPFLPMDFQLGEFSSDTAIRHLEAASGFFRGVAGRWGPAASMAVIVDRLKQFIVARKKQHRGKSRWEIINAGAAPVPSGLVAAAAAGGPDATTPVGGEKSGVTVPGGAVTGGSGGGGGGGDDAAQEYTPRSSPPAAAGGSLLSAGGGDTVSEDDFEMPTQLRLRDETTRKVLHRVCTSPFASISETLLVMTELARRGGIVELFVL